MEQFILIADDDEALAKLVKSVIESEGFLTATANDGKEAYRALKSGANFVAAIVDINMPYIDGADLVKFMRADPRFNNIPVLVMTGNRDPRASARALASGAIGFLPKPFSNTQLRNAVQALVGKPNGPGEA